MKHILILLTIFAILAGGVVGAVEFIQTEVESAVDPYLKTLQRIEIDVRDIRTFLYEGDH